MYSSHRSVMLIAWICSVIVLIAIMVRISRIPTPTMTHVATTPVNSTERHATTSSTFFEKPSVIDRVASYLFSHATSSTPESSAKPVVVSPISAEAYLVGDVQTGNIYIEQYSARALPVASMSKLVTAFVATNALTSTAQIAITEEQQTLPPDASGLRAGERFTMPELLYPMLLNSSNVAAEALASGINRIKFLELMSSYSWEIGMPSTYFADASGLSPNNKASAQDLFALARYLFKTRPDILALTRTPHASTATTTDHGSHEFTNIHPFVNDLRFLGGKTGHTPEAKDTMLTIMRVDGHPIAFIVLGSLDRAADTKYLIRKVERLISRQ